MNSVWTILKREYRERVRRRSFIIGTVLGPVFILGVTIVPIWMATRSISKPIRLLVIDNTNSLAGKLDSAFPDTLPDGSPRYQFDVRTNAGGSPEKALEGRTTERILAEELTGMLWLPADLLDGGEARLYAKGLGDPEVVGRFRSALNRAVMMHRLEVRGIPPEETDAISSRIPISTFKLSEKGVREGGFETDFITGFLFAMILYMTILLYGISVQRSVLEDKTSRIVEVLLSTVRPFHLMLGKIVGVGGVGITQYAIWSIVAVAGTAYFKGTNPALANMTMIPPSTLVFFVVYFVLGYFLFSAIYAAIGAMVNSDQEAQQTQMPITMLLVIPIILMQMLIRDPNSTTSVVLSLIPFFTPILMMLRIIVASPPTWQIALSILLMSVTVLACAAVAARIFRVGILMYGKRPTLPEIIRWVKQS